MKFISIEIENKQIRLISCVPKTTIFVRRTDGDWTINKDESYANNNWKKPEISSSVIMRLPKRERKRTESKLNLLPASETTRVLEILGNSRWYGGSFYKEDIICERPTHNHFASDEQRMILLPMNKETKNKPRTLLWCLETQYSWW